MERKVHFNKTTESVAGSEKSYPDDTSSKSKGKRKVEDTTQSQTKAEKSQKRRKVSVYDAVAGRAGKNGFLPTEPVYSKNRDTASSSTRPAAPDDILFNRKGARIRFAEEGDYVGIDDLGPIPPSELLETIHRYVSQFYDRPDVERKHLHYKSMDGTALLALGILLEETLEHSLGETGHLAFLADGDEDDIGAPLAWDGHAWGKKVSRQLGSRNGRSRSVHVDESPDEELSDHEASGSNVEEPGDDQNEDDEEIEYSPSGDVNKVEERTESHEDVHQIPTQSRKDAPPLLASASHEDINDSLQSTPSSRKKDDRVPRRVLRTNGYKSAPLVASSDEDEDEIPEIPVGARIADNPAGEQTPVLDFGESSDESEESSESEDDLESLTVLVLDRARVEGLPRKQPISHSDDEDGDSEREEFGDREDGEADGEEDEEESIEDDEEESIEDDEEESIEDDEEESSEDDGEKQDSDNKVTMPSQVPIEDKQAKFKRDMDALLARLIAE